MKPKATTIPPRPKMSEEEQKEQIIRFLSQKRESFVQGCLFNLCQGKGIMTEDESKILVDRAIVMADYLLEKLYPIKEE